MANDLEPRMKSIEEYQAMFYKWIDELRLEHIETRKRFEQNEDLLRQLADPQVTNSKILRGFNDKLNDHESRLSSAGI